MTTVFEDIRKSNLTMFDNFFRCNPTSLLIRGEPGCGKTTLGLELMNYMKHVYKGFYISTRVSYEKLVQQIPWSKELLSDESVLRPFSNSSYKASLVDVRLGSINSIVELVMSAVMKERSFIMLDSWDALAKESETNERLKAEKTLVALADANNSFLLFISEEPHLSTVSYLVDGVITLEQYNNLRCMRMDKMRGTTIEDKRIFYTLDGSHFTTISKSPPIIFKKTEPKLFEPITSVKGVSTGNKYLDKAIGKIRHGSVILLETVPNRDRRVLGILLLNMILNHLRSGNCVIIINNADKPHQQILEHIMYYCTKEDLQRLVIFSSEDNTSSIPYLEKMSYEDSTKCCNLILQRYRMLKNYNKPLLLTADIGMLEIMSNDEQIEILKKNIINAQHLFRANGDNMVFINTSNSKSFLLTQTTMDIHLKLYSEYGVSFIQLLKPYNGIYGVEVDNSKGYPTYTLKKMV